ncbi:MAG: S41 family peptidase [Acidobacteria bacterium]|nr:S41 family peptidase [Acidobacteriota bacterium]
MPGPRFAERDVYVLTSRRTFSAAEDFAYALKNLGRATIIGEVTGGGAHAGGPRRVHDHFFVFVPSARTTSPITGTDWEDTGVVPDIAVSAAKALAAAHLSALDKRAPAVDDPRMRADIAAAMERLRKELE